MVCVRKLFGEVGCGVSGAEGGPGGGGVGGDAHEVLFSGEVYIHERLLWKRKTLSGYHNLIWVSVCSSMEAIERWK